MWILALAVDCWDRIFRSYIRRYSPSIYWSFPRWKRCAQVLRFSVFGAFLVQGLSSLHLWIPALAFVCWDRIFRPSNFSSIFAIIRMRLLFSWPQNPAAESDFVLPTTDQEIQAALISFGADFKKMKGDVHAAVRADLLAGLKVASYASPRPFPAGCGSDHSPVVRSVSDNCYHGCQACRIFRRYSRPFRITSCPPTTRMLKQRLLPLVRSPRKNCNDAHVVVFSPVWRCSTRITTTSHGWSRP